MSRGWAPSHQHAALLRAALATDADAVRAAWAAWRADNPTFEPDMEGLRLVPLARKNLLAHDVSEDKLAVMSGVHRKAFSHNVVTARAHAAVLEALRHNGVPTLVLGGAALGPKFYGDLGLRLVERLHVLVPNAQKLAAIGALRTAGYRAEPPLPASASLIEARFSDAWRFADDEKRAVILHWHALATRCGVGRDEGFWQRAVAVVIGDAATLTLDASDQALWLAVRAQRPRAPARWVADVVTVARGGEVDWERVVAEAVRLGVVLPVRAALAYVDGLIAGVVPAAAIAALERAPVGAFDRVRAAALLRDGRSRVTPLAIAADFARFVDGVPAIELPSLALRYAKHRWKHERLWKVALRVARQELSRLNPQRG